MCEGERKRETENRIRCGGEENLIQILLEIYSLVDDESKSVQGNCINENCKSENVKILIVRNLRRSCKFFCNI